MGVDRTVTKAMVYLYDITVALLSFSLHHGAISRSVNICACGRCEVDAVVHNTILKYWV